MPSDREPRGAGEKSSVPSQPSRQPLLTSDGPAVPTSASHVGTRSATGDNDPVVLHLTGQLSMKYGGFERYLVEVARRCRERGVRSVVQHNGVPVSSRYRDDLEAAGGQVVAEDLDTGRAPAATRAVRLIAQHRPIVVHLHFCHGWTRLAVGLVAPMLGVGRTVATVHLMPGDESLVLLRAGYSRIDHILAVSNAVERALLERGVTPAALTTLYLGTPELGTLSDNAGRDVRARLKIPAASRVLVATVFSSPMKGVDVLLAAYTELLAAAWPALHLIIVGSAGPGEIPGLDPASLDLGRVHWVGTQDDVRPFLAAADIYVQPSRAEAFGLGIVEAMRQSLPVVATSVGGIPEAVADGATGVLVPPDSPIDLAAAIAVLLDDPELAQQMGHAGHERWRSRFGLAGAVEELITDHYGLPAC